MDDFKEYIESINSRFIKTSTGLYFYLDTATELTESEVNSYILTKVDDYKKSVQSNLNSIAWEYGIESTQRLINKRNNNKLNNNKSKYDGGEFNMVYRNGLKEISSLKLTLVEEGVFWRLTKFISYPSNSIMVENEIPSIDTLIDIVDIKERALRGHIKQLENKGLIKLVQSGHKKVIYINPKYCASGKELDLDTLKMFKLTKRDLDKINNNS